MIVRLEIERLVIEGLPLGAHEGPRLQAAVEAELARLIGEGGFDQRVERDRTEPLISTEPIARPAGNGKDLGIQIGRAIYGGIGQ